MIIECSAGTPNEPERKSYTTVSPAKGWIGGRIKAREKWAAKFNRDLEGRLRSIREEFDNLDLKTIPEGETRQWQATDELTKVRFVFKVKVVQK